MIMLFTSHLRKAFSLVELVFAIVVLGIVASIGAEIIVQVYENYITQRALHRTSSKTELAASQLANRLAYAIPDTIIARQSASTFQPISNVPNKNYSTLQWTGYDAESFTFTGTPGWSGFCDVDNAGTGTNALITPGSALGTANTIIGHLSGTEAKSLANAAIFFPTHYDENTIGYAGQTGTTSVTRVTSGTGTTFTLDTVAAGSRDISEHYKLAWSSYAIVPVLDSNGLYTLNLHHNFQPWDGDDYSSATITPLIRNVSVFNFTGTGNTIRFKLCTQENIGGTYPITTCKEKAVFR
ncbi:MAG: prepilin-type N-terminal cleavage/methylation domain-containing protein [Campylobacterota bacterium]|nr:prepilin-type N-terminal cleavage/methylation domain-containing protein [Campylobacterota bacterium]